MGEPVDNSEVLTKHRDEERLDSWKAVADFVGRSVRTAQRYEAEEGMPVHRHKHSDADTVYAFKPEITSWLASRQSEIRNLKPGDQEDPHGTGDSGRQTRNAPANPNVSMIGRLFGLRAWLAVVLFAAFALAAAGLLVISSVSSPPVRLQGYTQLTHDGHWKFGIATDGVWGYFFESGTAGGNLCKVPLTGGEVTCVPIDLPSAKVVAVSPDGAKVLLIGEQGINIEGAMWVAPVTGGQAHKVGTVTALDAAWAPRKKIVFTHAFGIWTINEDGTDPTQFLKIPEVAANLGWSHDGERLWYTTFTHGTPADTIWSVNSDGTGQRQLWAGDREHAGVCCGFWLANQKTLGFLELSNYQANLRVAGDDPWPAFARGTWLPLRRVTAAARVGFGLPWVARMAPDAAHNRLLALYPGPRQGRVYRFDPRNKTFQPMMEGTSARDIDFSPDGHSAVFVDNYDNSLWRYDLGQRARTPLVRTPFFSSLPRWSPDGRSIALTGMGPDNVWRIYGVSPQGGTPEPIIPNDPNEGAPTWSRDGRTLVFGKVDCVWSGGCGIYQYDLITRSLRMLPGSQGFRTARWSPDGRYIAALRPSDGGLMLFDCESRSWRRIYGPVAGDCLGWSHDSKYVYSHVVTGQDDLICRVSVPSSVPERVADLKDLQISGNRMSMWFGLAPDDSLLVAQAVVSNEIFSVSYQIP